MSTPDPPASPPQVPSPSPTGTLPGERLVPVGEVRAAVLASRRALPPRLLPIQDALGCVLARRVVAGEDVPPFANSGVDGYALHSGDTARPPAALAVDGTVLAGSTHDRRVEPGHAVRIMTGAPLPPGCDAVCMVERTRSAPDGAGVVIETSLRPGENVRHAGEDVRSGAEVFPAGTPVSPGVIGVLAGLGLLEVEVHPRPVVGVLSTGDELVEGPAALSPGKIRDANRYAVLALVAESGCVPVDLGIVGDDEDRVAAALEDGASRCDALVTSGGVSVGDRDVVRAVLGELSGGTMRWVQVAVRPGKPFAFGEIGPGRTPVFGLPGNPVSAMVSFELFARPALRLLAGHPLADRPFVRAVADEGFLRRADGKLHLVRARARGGKDGLVHVRSAGGQGSHQLHAMASANALVLLPDGPGAAAGASVDAMLLDDRAAGLEVPAEAFAWAP